MTRTFQLHISGIVQGVGFRPYIFNLAQKNQLKGWVCNTSSGVFIRFNSDIDAANSLLKLIVKKLPEKALILHSSLKEVDQEVFDEFTIISSFEGEQDERNITPDFATCPECLTELESLENRRLNYAFITCSNCGPRFSIIDALPYDRENTSMKDFKMCDDCLEEYNDPQDRRFYSQTNSCKNCGIKMELFDSTSTLISKESDAIIYSCSNAIKNGKILALKGIGGYMLIADALNKEAIETLRERKHRPEKPFALMVKDDEMLNHYVFTKESQMKSFQHESAPIVLFDKIKNTKLPIDLIAPELNEIGIMRAYTPLHYQLLREIDGPIIATSGNVSGTPIVYNDDEALQVLSPIADYILKHDRHIINSQDDSVIRLSKHDKKIIIRRSRGLAPNFISQKIDLKESVYALGAMLKSTYAILFKGNTLISHYIGNSNSYETQLSFRNSLNKTEAILESKPDIILCDKHPGYFTNEWAHELAKEYKIPLLKVQHHKAHFTAILGEHNLWKEKVCGIVWDGTGLGDDTNIWGGEAFIYEDSRIEHHQQLAYQKHILGDKMVNEPRLSALSYFYSFSKAKPFLKSKFSEIEWSTYMKQINKSKLKTSSMGRLFDAVASLLNLKDKVSFHGQAAMLLEAHALQFPDQAIYEPYYLYKPTIEFHLDDLMHSILEERLNNIDTRLIALRFHQSLVEYIKWIVSKSNAKHLAFSGGVFQNKLLVDLIQDHMSEEFKLFFHTSLSPNDESISFGQLMYYLHIERKS